MSVEYHKGLFQRGRCKLFHIYIRQFAPYIRAVDEKQVWQKPAQGAMKLITLEKVYKSLRDEVYVVTVSPQIAERARKAIERMFEFT